MLLSDRMKAVVGLVQPCDSIADIGCDHGYVAIELVRSNICQHVIAMDINKGPLERAKNNIKMYNMQDYIETRLSNGTRALHENEVEGIICAGIGGKLTISILEQGRELISMMKQIILQPQSEISEVRAYLRKNKFIIEQEDIIYEDGKYYPMMRVVAKISDKSRTIYSVNQNISYRKILYRNEDMSNEGKKRFIKLQDTYGGLLLEMSNPILKRYLQAQKEKLESIQDNLLTQDTQKQRERSLQIDDELKDINFCLDYYFGDNYTGGRKDQPLSIT